VEETGTSLNEVKRGISQGVLQETQAASYFIRLQAPSAILGLDPYTWPTWHGFKDRVQGKKVRRINSRTE
jgi:hypothetical protein